MPDLPTHTPPLAALRAFEAVARLGSLSRAAVELNVTKSAVSHQLRALESDLGATLLHRGGTLRRAQVTEAGATLLIRTAGFDPAGDRLPQRPRGRAQQAAS